MKVKRYRPVASISATGTIEGKLQVLTKKDRCSFSIKDEIIGRLVRCYFQENMLEDAKDAFDRRVVDRVSLAVQGKK